MRAFFNASAKNRQQLFQEIVSGLGLGLLLSEVFAVGIHDLVEAFVFFAVLFDEAAGDEILQFLISTETEHFFPSADRVARLQAFENLFKKFIKAEKFLFSSEDSDKFICYMVWESTGKSGSFRSCHSG